MEVREREDGGHIIIRKSCYVLNSQGNFDEDFMNIEATSMLPSNNALCMRELMRVRVGGDNFTAN